MPTSKTRYIDLNISQGLVSGIFRRFTGTKESNIDFSDVAVLRHLLSNERIRILYTIKNKKPESIYKLARILERDFKSVNTDVKFLEKFGFIELVAEKKGNRERFKPNLVVDSMHIVMTL